MNPTSFVAVVNSRQPLQPSSHHEWIRGTKRAIEFVQENGMGLISSVGRPNWEVSTAMGSICHLRLKVILPYDESDEGSKRTEWVTDQFDLNSDLVKFVSCRMQAGSSSQLQRERDRLIIEAADLILPVSIRPGGSLAKLIDQRRQSGGVIDDQFQIEYRRRSEPLAYSLIGVNLNPLLHHTKTDYVVHWTRASNGPWPDELLIEYYTDILASPRYPRLAIDCLGHILETGVIRASGRNLSSGIEAVSFSSVKPHQLVNLVKWRARRRMMSFEPYGIGFEPELAERLGVKPVIYYDRGEGPPSGCESEWQLQSQGQITDWRREQELRFPGHVSLSELPKDKLILYCLTPEEAKKLTVTYGIRAISFLA